MSGDRENIVKLNANHSSVCKFGLSQTDQDNFKLVRMNIKDLYKKALKHSELSILPLSTGQERRLFAGEGGSRNETIPDWISPIPYWLHHAAMRKGILPRSGEWLFEKREFQEWQTSIAGPSSVLWLRGIPGSGKSRLIACAIEHLKEHLFSHGLSDFAYFYCLRSGAETERSNPEEVIRSIFRQLAFEKEPISQMKPAIQFQYMRKEELSRRERHPIEMFSQGEIISMLADICKGTTTTIIIDALDELEWTQRGYLFDTFEAINDAMKECESDGTVRLLMSTREDPDIVARLANYRNIYIGMDDNKLDIERFVTRELETAIRHGTLTVSSEFRKEIEDTLNARAQAM
jgi:NACHT domain